MAAKTTSRRTGVAAERVLAQLPGQRRSALENRRFLRRAVRFLADEAGIEQFLDAGRGNYSRIR